MSSGRLLPEVFSPTFVTCSPRSLCVRRHSCFTFLRPVPVCSQAGHGQLRFLLNTYSHPCSCQSAHPAVNPSSRTQQRLTRGLTTQFISPSLSTFMSIHHSPAVIHLHKSDFSRQSFFFSTTQRPVLCISGIFLYWTDASAPSRVGWCCWFCSHDSRSLCAAGHDSRLSWQKLCPTPLRSPFLSSALPVPCNFLLLHLSGCFLMSLFSVSQGRYSRAIRGHQRQFVSFN